ncbi:MAG TPA: sialidase family protein [Casimicrobiaceae bacterium]|nr:sialidase family protein [Casimicrobiaceae bacterium]
MASPARASFETYIVDELYSNADGTVQYLLLRENQGLNQQDVLLAQTLAATHAGVTQTYVFDHNLPSKLTANKHVLVASAGFVARNAIVPDYVMPNRFLPIDGGTITYAGIDRVTYDSLPTDGVRALFRAAIVAPNVAINFLGATASVPPLPVTAVEFYNPQLDHYFVSALAADIDALDTGRIPGWYRTGQTFRVYPSAAAAGGAASPVCRFYIPPQHGDSHFLSAAPAECSAIAQRIGVDPNYSGYILESPAVFYVLLPDPVTGTCSTGSVPVYRLWNGRADSNHRYVIDPAIKAQMMALGYVPEGYGPDRVAMCAAPNPSDITIQVTSTAAFPPGCDSDSTGTLYVNTEVEPRIDIDPSNPEHLIGVWQQDRWSDGGARGLFSATSFDAGLTWSIAHAGFSRCTGGTAAAATDYARASDPWITISPDGTAYQAAIGLTGPTFGANAVDAVLVSRSSDGGRTWGLPVTLMRDARTSFDDKESITADPTDSRFVYAVWDRLAQAGGAPAWFARTADGGLTWEPARSIYDPGMPSQTLNNQVVVLPDGTLIDFLTQFDTDAANNTTARFATIRSTDHGLTWSAPAFIASSLAVGVTDPDTGMPVRDAANLASISAGRNGHLAIVWQDSRFSGGARDAIAFSQSADGGATWSPPVRINAAPAVPAFGPTVKIRDDGVIGVSYYDFRNNTADPGSLPTDYWLTQSSDGITWRETHVAGPFDLSKAPNARGLFLGDYQGLTSTATNFVPFWSQTTADPLGATSIFAGLPALAASAAKAAPEAEAPTQAQSAAPVTLTPSWQHALSEAAARTLQSRRRAEPPQALYDRAAQP